MRAEGRVCSSCGARNKPKWEFCVRCGESLADAVSSSASSAPEEAAAPAGDFPWKSWLVTAVLAVVAIGGYFALSDLKPPKAESTLFNIVPPTTAAPAPAEPIPDDPARRALTEGRKLLAAGSPEAALPLLAQAVADHPNDPESRMFYGRALAATGSTDAALSQLRAAATLAPNVDA